MNGANKMSDLMLEKVPSCDLAPLDDGECRIRRGRDLRVTAVPIVTMD
jgi:hypothetical protein